MMQHSMKRAWLFSVACRLLKLVFRGYVALNEMNVHETGKEVNHFIHNSPYTVYETLLDHYCHQFKELGQGPALV
jgi:hypothetical protein